MKNIRITLAYDGSNYLGWQDSKSGLHVEGVLTKTLRQILQEDLSVQAASRTDTGVHAQGQVAQFFTRRDHLDLIRLQKSLNALLPPDIVCIKMEVANLDFHPSLDCCEKEYRYTLCTLPFCPPQDRLYCWHYPYSLDLTAMQEEALSFLGEHDFASFCNQKKNEPYSSTVRNIFSLAITPYKEGFISFEIVGKHFLYKMVRNIVGYLVYVGCGKITKGSLPHILEQKNRCVAGVTAPAKGLSLYRISYKN